MALEVLSGKVTPEVKEQFQAAQQNSEALTFNAFTELLLEAFLNPKTKPVEVVRPSADQLQELQLKDNEIGRLKSAYSVIESNNQELQAEILRLTNLNSELSNQAAPEPIQLTPAPDQVLITIPAIMSVVLDAEKELAEKKSGKKWSFGDLLLNNFWESIKNGASHPFRIWSSAELSNLAKQIKELQENESKA